jgi:hypothetical protein
MGTITSTASTKPGVRDIPEIIVKDPERIERAKWRMIDRETKDSGLWIRQDLGMAWREGREAKGRRLGEEPTVYKEQQTGQ